MIKQVIVAGALSFAIGASAAAAEGVKIEFKNNSSWTIHHLYLSPVNESEWGPDQLGDGGEDVIEPGATFTLTDVAPGKHDLKIIDDDGDSCVVASEKLGSDTVYDITDEDLFSCEAATEEVGDEE